MNDVIMSAYGWGIGLGFSLGYVLGEVNGRVKGMALAIRELTKHSDTK